MMNPKIVSEISRTENVVADMISHHNLLSKLPIFVTRLPSEFFRRFPRIKGLVEELYDAEKKIRDEYMSGRNADRYHHDIYEEEPLFEHHKRKVSVLVGYLRANPDVVEYLKKCFPREMNAPSKSFFKVLNKYEIMVKTKLNTTNEEKEHHKEQKNDLGLKAKKLRTDEKNLEKRLQMERKRRFLENQALDHDLTRLREDLNGFVREYQAGKKGYDSQLEMKEKTITDHFTSVKNGLLHDIKKTKERLDEMKKENKKSERVERGETMAKESQAKSSINQYDDFMIDSTETISGYKESFEFNTKRIKELGSGIEDLKVDKTSWERQKKDERKEFLAHIRKMQAVAVAKISMMETWRKYRDKHFPKKKSRGGKRRKKGKKGKKGGKKKKKGKK